MTKQLLHENSDLLNEISFDLKQYLPLLEQVKITYENLQLEKFSDEILKEIVNTGTGQIEKLFNDSLNNQIEKSGISNTILKNNILKDSEQLYFSFLDKTRELKKFKPETYSRKNYLKLKFISYVNGSFILTNENKEQILESECRVYLENEKDLKLYENLKKFIESYNELSDNLKELEFRFSYEMGKGLTGVANNFLITNESHEYSINPGAIKFATNYKENSLKFNS